MNTPPREQTHLWQAPALGDVEMLHARYFQQRFAPMCMKATCSL